MVAIMSRSSWSRTAGQWETLRPENVARGTRSRTQPRGGINRRLDYSIVIPHRLGVATLFLLVKDVFSGLLVGPADGSG